MLDSIKFNDDNMIDEEASWLKDLTEYQDLKRFKEQCEADTHNNWGDSLNVLIMSDRCPGRATGLHEYLEKKTNLSNVILCNTFDDAKAVISDTSFDILIFVGYQKTETNYDVKKSLEEKNPNIYTVKYASLDYLIKAYCVRHNIKYAFSSREPAAEFIKYLKESYKSHCDFQSDTTSKDNLKSDNFTAQDKQARKKENGFYKWLSKNITKREKMSPTS